MIYLDNAASSPVFPELIEKFPEFLRNYYPNPEATHAAGYRSLVAVKAAERVVLESLRAEKSAAVIWTGTATEAINLAIRGYCAQFDGGTIVSTRIEHKAVLKPIANFGGCTSVFFPVTNEGVIDVEKIKADPTQYFTPKTRIVAIGHVNNEVGSIQPIAEISALRKKYAPKAKLLIDASQSYCKLPINWHALELDFLVSTAHKIGAVNGTAILVYNKEVTFKPLVFGGGQQNNLRSGTINTPGIVAFAEAVKLHSAKAEAELNHIQELNRECRQALSCEFGDKVQFHSPEDGAPHILSVALNGYQGAILMRGLGSKEVIVGTGSACSAESQTGSHVMRELNVSKDIAFSTLRVSFGTQNTKAEVQTFISVLKATVADY